LIITTGHRFPSSPVAPKRISFTYNNANEYDKVSRYASTTPFELVSNTFYKYDDAGRLAGLIHTMDTSAPSSGWGTNPLAGYMFTYDAASRIEEIDSYLDDVSSFGYDNTSQLTAADHDAEDDEDYSYDENGNRTMSGYDTGGSRKRDKSNYLIVYSSK
jgi:hypothetical protein